MFRILAVAAALFAAAPAFADVSARYRGPDGTVMLVEADGAGQGRIGAEEGSGYGLFTAEGAFVVWEEEGGLRIARYADLKTAIDRQIAGLFGEEVAAAPTEQETAGPAMFMAAGTETIGGRTGTAYREAGADVSLVLSGDPALASVGAVLARAVLETPTFEATLLGRPSGFVAELAALLRGGAPLRFADAVLEGVTFDPIPPARLVLPGTPMSLAELEAALAEPDESGDE